MTALLPTGTVSRTKDPNTPDRSFRGLDLRKLAWDSDFFGHKMGVFTPNPEWLGRRAESSLVSDLQHALAESADDGYEHVMLRVPGTDLRLARAAESSGLRLVDIGVDLTMLLNPAPSRRAIGGGVRPATADDLAVLQEIAQSSFTNSRFMADPFFDAAQGEALHRTWISNLFNGLAACVLVAYAQDEVVGFTSCAVQNDGSGRIPLIATSDAHRRQGIGRALVEASIAWFTDEGVRRAWVKTQASNHGALALYARAGFVSAACELTFTAALTRQTLE